MRWGEALPAELRPSALIAAGRGVGSTWRGAAAERHQPVVGRRARPRSRSSPGHLTPRGGQCACAAAAGRRGAETRRRQQQEAAAATGRGRWRSRGLRAATRGPQVRNESAAPQGARGRRLAPLLRLPPAPSRPLPASGRGCWSPRGRRARVAP